MIPVPIVTVFDLGPVFVTFLTVTWGAEQLALHGFLDEQLPTSGEVRADREPLGRGVDVIERKIVGGAASGAPATEKLDELSFPTVLLRLDVAPKVLSPCLAGLGHRQEPLPG